MLYNLILVIFMASGDQHRVPLVQKVSWNFCVDLRDQVRGQISSLNELQDEHKYQNDVIEFVDAECEAQKIVY